MRPVSDVCSSGCKGKKLISTPYRTWKDARADLAAHATLLYHKDSMVKLQELIKSHENTKDRIDIHEADNATEIVARNRQVLESVIKCLEFCERQALSVRGHRDDGLPGFFDGNIGNFKSLLHLVSLSDHSLKNHLEAYKKNTSYTSKTTQNGLLDCMKDFIQQSIVEEVKSQGSPFYG